MVEFKWGEEREWKNWRGGGEGVWLNLRRGSADYRGMVQSSQQHGAPCVKGVEWELGSRGLRMLALFWASIPVEVAQQAGVVPRCRQVAIGIPF